MSFIHDPNRLRESVQHQVEAVVHQADGLLHSPRKGSRYVSNHMHRYVHVLSLPWLDSRLDHERQMIWVLCVCRVQIPCKHLVLRTVCSLPPPHAVCMTHCVAVAGMFN